MTATPTILTGVAIGTPGSYQGKGNTIDKALTGKPGDFFDSASPDNNWVGLDLGSLYSPTSVSFAQRPDFAGWSGYPKRMIGGKIQGANKPDFSDAVELLLITTPPVGVQSHPLPGGSFRYLRYLSPPGSFGNISCLSFMGVPVANPVNDLPGTPPLSGIPAVVQSVYHAGQAPCVAYFDARNIASCRDRDSAVWNFGDAVELHADPRSLAAGSGSLYLAVDLNVCITSPTAAHLYRRAGTYTVTCTTLDGVVHSLSVVVDPDTRAQVYFSPKGSDSNKGNSPDVPLQTAGMFEHIAAMSNVHIHLNPACVMSLKDSIQLQSNVVIECNHSLIHPSVGGLAFAGWPGRTADVLILDAHAVAVSSPAAAGTQFLRFRGQRLAWVGGTFGSLDRVGDVTDDGTDGVLLQDVAQLDPQGTHSQDFYIGGNVKHVCKFFLTLTGSNAESPDRNTGGMLDGVGEQYCLFSQPHKAKAGFVDRGGTGHVFSRNYIVGCEASWSVGIGDPKQSANVRVKDVGIFDNVFRPGPAPDLAEASISIKAGVSGVTIEGNDIRRDDGGPVIAVINGSDVGMPDPADIVIKPGNRFWGNSFKSPGSNASK